MLTTAGETLLSIAQTQLGDASRWREVADANDINPLEQIAAGIDLQIPELNAVTRRVQPVLGKVASGLNSARGVLDKVSSVLGDSATAEINNVLGEAIEIVETVSGAAQNPESSLRQYGGEAVKLIDWLLE